MRTACLLAVTFVLLMFACSGAWAAGPNLLVNGDFEQGAAVTDPTQHVIPTGWLQTADAAYGTANAYGIPDFPSVALGASINGGKNYFSGGPSKSGSMSFVSAIAQTVSFGAQQSLVTAGHAKLAVTGCLGGVDDVDNRTFVNIVFYNGATLLSSLTPLSADNTDRGNKTGFVGRANVVAIPANATKVQFELAAVFSEKTYGSSYLDAYADNVTMEVQDLSATAPTANCGNAPATPAPTIVAPKLGFSKKSAKIRNRKVKLPLVCVAAAGGRCQGSLKLSLSGPKSIAGKGLSKKTSFNLTNGSKKTFVGKVPKRLARKLAGLSSKQAGKLKLKLVTRISGVTSSQEIPLSR